MSNLYTLQYAVEQCGQQVGPQFFLQIELRILSLLNMKTKLITPYWFLETVHDLFPEKDITLLTLTSIIDFFMAQPEVNFVSCEVLFFAALLASFQAHNSSPLCFEIVKALTNQWKEAI